MIKGAKKQTIFSQYLIWHFIDMPKEILKAWRNFLLFNLNYFSIPLLIRTLFSYWRQYQWSYGRGFDAARYLETFVSNLISRILGAIVRIFLIIFGIICEIFIFFSGLIIFLTWFILPLILIAGLIFGIFVIF